MLLCQLHAPNNACANLRFLRPLILLPLERRRICAEHLPTARIVARKCAVYRKGVCSDVCVDLFLTACLVNEKATAAVREGSCSDELSSDCELIRILAVR